MGAVGAPEVLRRIKPLSAAHEKEGRCYVKRQLYRSNHFPPPSFASTILVDPVLCLPQRKAIGLFTIFAGFSWFTLHYFEKRLGSN